MYKSNLFTYLYKYNFGMILINILLNTQTHFLAIKKYFRISNIDTFCKYSHIGISPTQNLPHLTAQRGAKIVNILLRPVIIEIK